MSDAVEVEEDFEEEDAIEPSTPSDARAAVAIIVSDVRRMIDLSTQDEADALGEYLSKRVQPAIKRVKEIFKDPKEQARKAVAAIAEAEANLLRPLEQVKESGKAAIERYVVQAREQARAQEQATIERALAVAADLRASEARSLEAQGEVELAQEVRSTPLTEHVPVATPATPRVRGMPVSEKWTVHVEDFRAVCLAVAEGKIPEAALQFNPTFANRIAQAAKGRIDWPGVRVESTVSVRTGRA